MKKLVLVVVLVAVIGTGTVFAQGAHPNKLGIGILWGGNVGNHFSNNLALSLKVPSVPIFWGITARITNDWFAVGVQGDYYMIGSYFVGDMLGWFLGLGFYANAGFGDNSSNIGFGARLPVGLTFQPLNFFEVFLNIAPQVGGAIWISGDKDGFEFPHGGFFNFELGIRFWL